MEARRRRYWALCDFAQGRGLEVGPLARAIVGRDEADVSYVDVLDRDGLVQHYAGDPNVPADAIPEIDYHLIQEDGRTLSLAEAVKGGAPFDWVMASHVIEHVPDLIGWLAQLAEVVVDDGVLVLAVPDRRYCFDAHRPPTTVGQLVAAHEAGDIRPSIAAVYDYFSCSVDVDVRALWKGSAPTYSRRIHTLDEARLHVERTQAGEYVDCHVWLFSPDSFLNQMSELRRTGRSAWAVDLIVPTPRNDLEFQVRMRRLPRTTEMTVHDLPGEVVSPADMPDWVEERTRGHRVDLLERRVAQLERRLESRAAKLRRLRSQVHRQQGELTTIKHSRSWRAAQLLAAPTRWVRRHR